VQVREWQRVYGTHTVIVWNTIAEKMEGRNGKQCRDRWNTIVNPDLNRSPLTYDECIRIDGARRDPAAMVPAARPAAPTVSRFVPPPSLRKQSCWQSTAARGAASPTRSATTGPS